MHARSAPLATVTATVKQTPIQQHAGPHGIAVLWLPLNSPNPFLGSGAHNTHVQGSGGGALEPNTAAVHSGGDTHSALMHTQTPQ